MYCLRIETPSGDRRSLFTGTWEACETAFDAMQAFPEDVVKLELYHTDSCETILKWESPFWAE